MPSGARLSTIAPNGTVAGCGHLSPSQNRPPSSGTGGKIAIMSLLVTAARLPASSPGVSGWTAIATIAAVIAAGAALVTVIHARRTVLDGRAAHRELMQAERQARKDFTAAHQEAMTAQQQAGDAFATAHREAMTAQALAREDFAAGRAEEMQHRKRALDAQIALERLAQAGRVTEILIMIARTARDETISPPPTAAGSQRATFIPSLQAQLRAALAVFYALGGPTLDTADDLAAKAYSLTTQPIEMLQLATNSLGELKRLTGQDENLRLM